MFHTLTTENELNVHKLPLLLITLWNILSQDHGSLTNIKIYIFGAVCFYGVYIIMQ